MLQLISSYKLTGEVIDSSGHIVYLLDGGWSVGLDRINPGKPHLLIKY